jgi:hypothetical protein
MLVLMRDRMQVMMHMLRFSFVVLVPMLVNQIALDQSIIVSQHVARRAFPANLMLLAEHHHPDGDFLDDVLVVRRRDDCLALLRQLADEIDQAALTARIKRRRRLIEQPNVRTQ